MNPPPISPIEREPPSRDDSSSYPNKRVRMSPSAAGASSCTSTNIGAEPSPTTSTSTCNGPPSIGELSSPIDGTPPARPFHQPVHPGVSQFGLHASISDANTTGVNTDGASIIENKLAPKTGSSSFRNVSACNRCRMRKNRCDQRLPSCAACGKANARCVGYDPITKREIPRSYVYYLEARVDHLENLLKQHSVPYPPSEVLDHSAKPVPDPVKAAQGEDWRQQQKEDQPLPVHTHTQERSHGQRQTAQEKAAQQRQDEANKLDKLVSNVGMISVAGTSDPRYLGSTSGISFARVVFAAVKSSVNGANSDKGSTTSMSKAVTSAPKQIGPAASGTSMRDSFFGLQTKPTIQPAPFPNKEVAMRLVNFYFEHANPQVPILHRGEFMKMFNAVYADEKPTRTARQSYMLNIVFAIGAGIYLGETGTEPENASGNQSGDSSPEAKRKPQTPTKKGVGEQAQPEEYHASAIVHLEACLQSTIPVDRPDGFGGGLEELQAVLLLAAFALLRPVAPGLWYIVGVAVRLAVDLGLHYEDGKDIDVGLSNMEDGKKASVKEEDRSSIKQEQDTKVKGRREWMREWRRRLWWCTYSYDRHVSTCVGRPFGITDQVITTEFPSILEDTYITPSGFDTLGLDKPSGKHVAYHYFRFRLLQSEILQVLQHQQAQAVLRGKHQGKNQYMHTELPSPFLVKHNGFREWRKDIDRRLWQWKESAPTPEQSAVKFCHQFLELNYWQAIIMLYRQSLSVPKQFENEYRGVGVESPAITTVELREDEERVFLKVAEAGQRTLRLYRTLHRIHLVNYTFLSTHHLFMAGISFLYAIWHSPMVRSRLTMDEVDFTILAATSVLGDMIENCPPAEACRDAFERMSKATVAMAMSRTGFGSPGGPGLRSRRSQNGQQESDTQQSSLPVPRTRNVHNHTTTQSVARQQHQHRQHHRQQSQTHGQKQLQQQPSQHPSRPRPQFDMGLNDLYAPSSVLPSRTRSYYETSASQMPSQIQTNNPPQVNYNKRNSIGEPTKPEQQSPVGFSIPRSLNPSPAPGQQAQSQQHYGLSPPIKNFNSALPSSHGDSMIDPALSQHQQPQPYMRTNSAELTPTNLAAANLGSYLPANYVPTQNVEVDFSNLPNVGDFSNLDFLNDPNGYANGQADVNMADGGMDGMGGMNLGFGWGAEGANHGFSERGNQFDFFDGFYFGTGV